MEFSMILEAQMVDTSPANEQQVLHDCVEQVVAADELGFDRVWAVEHHCLTQYAHMSAPETFLAYCAGKTSRIRVGHGVVCLPFRMNHPIKVAERVAMLDVLSNGRMDFGVGKGGTETEAGAFDIDIAEIDAQLETSFRMIPQIWASDVYSFENELIRVPERRIHPKPVQQPHPPLSMACTREVTLNQAGEWGVGALCLGFGGPEDIAQKNRVYRAAIERRTAASQVGAVANDKLSALCPAIIMDDGQKARKIGHRGQRFFTESITHFYGAGPPPTAPPEDEDDAEFLRTQGEAVVAYLHEERIEAGTEQTGLYNPNHAYGTVQDAIGYVERLVDAGADEVMFLIQMGTVPQKAALETIHLIGKEVIPHFDRG
jgi:alkanesulfonate monooxygenase SsuD/methylene tetrahydromethanopterin reductase-like flavin-dependent oxidoreductase (luciferase family)